MIKKIIVCDNHRRFNDLWLILFLKVNLYFVTSNILAYKRSSDISSAKAVVGTCKDMCPEKVK